MNKRQKILITGSAGILGNVIVAALSEQGHELVLIDKNTAPSVDLLKDPLDEFFSDVETVIHLAAHPGQSIKKKLAEQNVLMMQKVLEAGKKSTALKRIVNASSINVYPYFEMYAHKKTIGRNTPLAPNLYWPPGEYARAKIEAEHMAESFCKERQLASVQLRFGHVSSDDMMTKFAVAWKNDIEHKTFLTHEDLRKIITASITLEGSQSYLCISNPSWLADSAILFPLEQ